MLIIAKAKVICDACYDELDVPGIADVQPKNIPDVLWPQLAKNGWEQESLPNLAGFHHYCPRCKSQRNGTYVKSNGIVYKSILEFRWGTGLCACMGQREYEPILLVSGDSKGYRPDFLIDKDRSIYAEVKPKKYCTENELNRIIGAVRHNHDIKVFILQEIPALTEAIAFRYPFFWWDNASRSVRVDRAPLVFIGSDNAFFDMETHECLLQSDDIWELFKLGIMKEALAPIPDFIPSLYENDECRRKLMNIMLMARRAPVPKIQNLDREQLISLSGCGKWIDLE